MVAIEQNRLLAPSIRMRYVGSQSQETEASVLYLPAEVWADKGIYFSSFSLKKMLKIRTWAERLA